MHDVKVAAPTQRTSNAALGVSNGVGDTAVTPSALFVAAMAEELGLDESSAARRTRRQLQRLTNWAVGRGIPLDRELILDPDTIERFTELGMGAELSRATYRAVLRRVAPLLTRTAPWEPRRPVVARRQVAPPYTGEEIELLRGDAGRQSTPKRRRAARALLALGLGAGLDGRWVAIVAAKDVSRRGGAVLVTVGEPMGRDVVVLRRWEDEVLELADTAGDEFLVGGHSRSRRRTGHITEELSVPTGHPRLAPARLRSTWLLRHLEAGTRLPELCRAAGLESATVLSDLLPLVCPLDDDRARSLLRLSES